MLTRMTEQDWVVALEAFRAARSRRGDKGRDDRRFLEALHSFAVHNVTRRALPSRPNSVTGTASGSASGDRAAPAPSRPSSRPWPG
jgi:hypothetical protein